jgi:hypothetical protein
LSEKQAKGLPTSCQLRALAGAGRTRRGAASTFKDKSVTRLIALERLGDKLNAGISTMAFCEYSVAKNALSWPRQRRFAGWQEAAGIV